MMIPPAFSPVLIILLGLFYPQHNGGYFAAEAYTTTRAHGFKYVRIPRFTMEEFAAASEDVRTGDMPFVLSGIGSKWKGLHEFPVEELATNYSDAIVEFYPNNLIDIGNKPYLIPFRTALDELRDNETPKYLQWRMTINATRHFLEYVDPLPKFLQSPWVDQCFEDEETRNNFQRVTSWHLLIIGNDGAGMFHHWDAFYTGAWQAQVAGLKEWILCPPQDEHLFGGAGKVNTFEPDFRQRPQAKRARCGRILLYPGDVVYYPSNWWHETRNHGYPTVSLTGRIVTKHNFDSVYQSLRDKCLNPGEDISKTYKGAPPNPTDKFCKNLPNCHKQWQQEYPHAENVIEETSEFTTDDDSWRKVKGPHCRVDPQRRLDCHLHTPFECWKAGCCWHATRTLCKDTRRICPVCFAPE
eukprot:gb/GECG01007519.1/.p1 GENE.gb/GECG01007519.1/~~gb/GECG01007519.1/.p1  ORF type:complete len:411 (+),score=30.99 gb/GECG01007519.1/:1-1233(+)